jgi:hypothetical protein
LAFLHEARLSRSCQPFAITVDCLRLTSVLAALCHEALQRSTGEWLAIFADRPARTGFLRQGGGYGADGNNEASANRFMFFAP